MGCNIQRNMSSEMIRFEYEEPLEPSVSMASDVSEFESALPDTATVEVRRGEAERVYGQVMDEIDGYESEYGSDAPHLVLGEEDYVILDVLLREDGAGGVGPHFTPTKVVTVPGRMIHIPRPEGQVKWEVAKSTDD